jgi:imidazolonepropionase-like amidohydrolase
VHITRGHISAISVFEDVPADAELIEAAPESIVMPGLIDTHACTSTSRRPD